MNILPTHTPALFDVAVARAADVLRAGGLVALPTETVYGLAANALDARAVGRIFAAKGRPANNPIIVHVADVEMARRCASRWPAAAESLGRAFWPGALTLVVPRASEVPDAVTAGGETVGIRWPSHPLIQAVIRACGFPLAAPSANRSGEISPTNAAHVRKSLGEAAALIIDGGQSQIGIESTVIDVSGDRPRLLRPGMIGVAAVEAVLGLGALEMAPGRAGVLRSPGLLEKHYAPKAKLLVWRWRTEEELALRAGKLGVPHAAIHIVAHRVIPLHEKFGGVSVIPHDVEAFGRALYGELHACDEAGAQIIVVEAPPDEAGWEAICDRLKRASSD